MEAKEVHVEILQNGMNLINDSNPLSCLQQIVGAYTDYKTVAEIERTKRRDIEAWERLKLAEIKAKRDLMMAYLEQSFDERATNFKLLFQVVDEAVAEKNHAQLALALESITDLAKTSPFAALVNIASVKSDLDNPNHEWKF